MQYARIKPYNGKTNKLRNYTVFGVKFIESKGWYKVADDIAAYLSTVTQDGNDPDSLPGFDVVDTLDEARAIDERERKKAARAMAEDAQPAVRVHVATRSGTARAHRVRPGEKLDRDGQPIAPVVLPEGYPGGGTVTTGNAKDGATHRAQTVKFYDSAADDQDDDDAGFVEDMALPPRTRRAVPVNTGAGNRGVEGSAISGGLAADSPVGGSSEEGDDDEGGEGTSENGEPRKSRAQRRAEAKAKAEAEKNGQ